MDELITTEAQAPMEGPEPEEVVLYLRPLGWLTTPKVGLFDGQGNLLEELEFEPVTVFYPHGQNLHRLQQEYIERARARMQERR